MMEDDLGLSSQLLLTRYPPELFAFSRLGISLTRFAARTAGEGWNASVSDPERGFRVLNISRIGVALEGPSPLKVDERYQLTLAGPAGVSTVAFYVLRCALQKDATGLWYRLAGLFTDLLERKDLPA